MRIVDKKPVSLKELKKITNFGSTRTKSFGADIINTVLDFLGFKKQDFNDKESIKEMILSNSAAKTMELLDEGFSIDEIIKERNLSRSTIENHIIEIVKKGFYPASDFVDESHLEIISEYFEETNDTSLSAARDVLGEEYSFFELKLALIAKGEDED